MAFLFFRKKMYKLALYKTTTFMSNRKQLLPLLAIVFVGMFAFSCKKSSNKGTTASGVYIVGDIEPYNPGQPMPILWKDGVPTDLSNGKGGNATSIFIYGNDVYVGGTLSDSISYTPVIWKNGTPLIQQLLNPSDVGSVMDVCVQDVNTYACGSIYTPGKGSYYAVYWVNEAIKPLPSGPGNATSIAISGNDVYVGGYLTDTLSSLNSFPVIWKNGNIIFTDTAHGQINSIYINGNDVYAAGSLNTNTTVPVLWKNGIPTILYANGGNANHVFVKNGDVYVSGDAYYAATAKDIAMVWKNGATTTLVGLGYPGIVKASAMLNNDFYSVSNRYDILYTSMILWKNGQESVVDSSYGNVWDIAVK